MEKLLEKIVSAAYPGSTADKIVSDHSEVITHLKVGNIKMYPILNSNALITLVNKNLIVKFTASLKFSLIK